jgi:hypothetical protein
VEPQDRPGDGCRITVRMVVDGPAGRLLSTTALAAYVPLAAYAVHRLARLAERDHHTAQAAISRLSELGDAEDS